MDQMLPLHMVVVRETSLKSIREERKKINNKKAALFSFSLLGLSAWAPMCVRVQQEGYDPEF